MGGVHGGLRVFGRGGGSLRVVLTGEQDIAGGRKLNTLVQGKVSRFGCRSNFRFIKGGGFHVLQRGGVLRLGAYGGG